MKILSLRQTICEVCGCIAQSTDNDQRKENHLSGKQVLAPLGGCRVQGSGIRVQGSEVRVQGSRFRVECSGFRIQRGVFSGQGSGAGVTDNEQRTENHHSGKQVPPHIYIITLNLN